MRVDTETILEFFYLVGKAVIIAGGLCTALIIAVLIICTVWDILLKE